MKIIGIGRCGNNILEFIKKQDFTKIQDKHEFVSVENITDIASFECNEADKIFTISGFGGDSSAKLTIDLTKKLLKNNVQVKNMIIFPFNIESRTNKAIQGIDELSSVHKNIEIFSNDALLNEDNQDKTMAELMKIYDSEIFNTITIHDKRQLYRSFIISTKKDDKVYTALVHFWSKSYTIDIVTPKFESFYCDTSIGFISDFRWNFKDDSDKCVMDVEEHSMKMLVEYIEKEKGYNEK